jgi:hypothetical protein
MHPVPIRILSEMVTEWGKDLIGQLINRWRVLNWGHCDGPGDNIMNHEFTQLAVEHLNGFEDWLPYIITYTLMNHH